MDYQKQIQLLNDIEHLIIEKKTYQLNRFTNPENYQKKYIKKLKIIHKPLKQHLKAWSSQTPSKKKKK